MVCYNPHGFTAAGVPPLERWYPENDALALLMPGRHRVLLTHIGLGTPLQAGAGYLSESPGSQTYVHKGA